MGFGSWGHATHADFALGVSLEAHVFNMTSCDFSMSNLTV